MDVNALGSNGEVLVYLRLSSLKNPRRRPLFRPALLGAKYPTVDMYVELEDSTTVQEFFLVQVKTTHSASKGSSDFQADGDKLDLMLRYPVPTYFAFVEEDSGEIYFKSVHTAPVRRAYSKDTRFLLDEKALETLRDEVRAFWKGIVTKPSNSYFHDANSW